MDVDAVLAELERCGSEQTRSTYRRHGVGDPLFGVRYSDLNRLAKRLRVDHDLAKELWATGNHDARILACKISDPARFTVRDADAWMRDAAGAANYVVVEALAGALADTPIAPGRAQRWRDRKAEWTAACGWALTAMLVSRDGVVSDAECRKLLRRIVTELPDAANRVRHEMNMTVIAIGGRGGSLERAAIDAARRIGPVEVDHGATSCVTPDAEAYIRRIAARAPA